MDYTFHAVPRSPVVFYLREGYVIALLEKKHIARPWTRD